MADRLIRITTALAVATVAAMAAVISYRHAYELVSTHGETGVTARLVPFTVDGLILAASMLILDANRRNQAVPALARWCLSAGIVATIGANLAHGLGRGPIGALVSAWPALALAGSFELLMTLIRTGRPVTAVPSPTATMSHPVSLADHQAPPALTQAPGLEQIVRAWHRAGRSQRAMVHIQEGGCWPRDRAGAHPLPQHPKRRAHAPSRIHGAIAAPEPPFWAVRGLDCVRQ